MNRNIQDINIRTNELVEARALNHKGDIQASIGAILVLGGGTLGFLGLGLESTGAEVAVTVPSFAVAAGGIAMIGLGVRKIFQADKVLSY